MTGLTDRTSFYIMIGGFLFGLFGAIKDIDSLFGLGFAFELLAIFLLLAVEIPAERRTSKLPRRTLNRSSKNGK